MKIKKQNKTKSRFLKTYLTMLQTYLGESVSMLKLNSATFLNKKLEIVELHSKVAFKIIQDYHLNNRKILFISRSSVKNSILNPFLVNTLHKYIETSAWTYGILKSGPVTSTTTTSNKVSSLKQKKSVLDLYEKPDLIVILDLGTESIILKEIAKIKVPTIVVKNDLSSDKYITYKILGNVTAIEYGLPLNLYTFLLYSILKKKRK